MADAYFNGEKGRWITTKTKKHVFIPEGKSVEEVLSEMFEEEEFDSPDNNNDISISDDLIYQSSNLSQKEEEFIRKIYSNLNPDALNILKDFNTLKIEKTDKKVSKYIRSKALLLLNNDVFKEIEPGTDYYATGETQMHETGHFIDAKLCKEISNGFGYASASFVSPTYNMSLHNAVAEEKSKLSRKDSVKLSILLDLEFIDKFTNDPVIKDIANYYDKYMDEAIETISMRTYLSDKHWSSKKFKENYILGNTDNMEEFRNSVMSYIADKVKENFDLENWKKFANIYLKSAYYGRQKYSIFSDALSSRRNLTQYKLAGIGHSASYYNKRLYDGLGSEFFANYFSAWSRNDKEQMEVTRKYMPKSCDIFDEMIEAYKINKGVII